MLIDGQVRETVVTISSGGKEETFVHQFQHTFLILGWSMADPNILLRWSFYLKIYLVAFISILIDLILGLVSAVNKCRTLLILKTVTLLVKAKA